MIAIEKRSSQVIFPVYGSLPAPEPRSDYERIDPEIFERQCALLERNEQAAKQRARENEYWRQRTLARKMHLQKYSHTARDLEALTGDAHALEAMDPKHRIGEMLNVFMDEYNKLRPAQLFLDWVDSMTLLAQVKLISKVMDDNGHAGDFKPEWVRAFNRSVCHMYAAVRGSYKIQIRNGLLFQNNALFDTGKMNTRLSGAGAAIFLQSADGTFYSSSHVWGRLHHSSLASDVAIRSAGEWQVEKGKIAWISGKCGHCKSTMDQLVTAIGDLNSRNALNKSKARCFDIQNSIEVDVDASSLLSNSHDFLLLKKG